MSVQLKKTSRFSGIQECISIEGTTPERKEKENTSHSAFIQRRQRGGEIDLLGSLSHEYQREPVIKISMEATKERFWLVFTFLLETINGPVIKIPLI